MNKRLSLSIALASYNGEQYISEQLAALLGKSHCQTN